MQPETSSKGVSNLKLRLRRYSARQSRRYKTSSSGTSTSHRLPFRITSCFLLRFNIISPFCRSSCTQISGIACNECLPAKKEFINDKGLESRCRYKIPQNFDKMGFGVYDVSIKSKEASNMITLQKLAEQYLLACKYQKNLDPKTIKAYRIEVYPVSRTILKFRG